MKNLFSKRTNWNLEANPITKALQKRRDSQLPILDLTESNPTHCGFDYPTQELAQVLTQPQSFQYHPNPKGLLEARRAIAKYYQDQGHSINPEQIFLTSSTSEAYSFLFRLLVNPQENILIPRPGYPLFDFLSDLADVELKTYSLFYEKNWQIDFESLKNNVNPDTKALLVVHPNNPTGSYIKKNEFFELIQLAHHEEIALVSDEVFFDYAVESNEKHTRLAGISEVLSFTLNGLSKMVGLPQMKLGWMVVNGPQKLLTQALDRLEVITDTYLSVNTPIQQALPWIIENCKTIQNPIKMRVLNNLKWLKEKIIPFPACEVLKVEGGWYALLKIPKTRSDEEWVLTFLEKEGVFVHPGHFYQFEKEGYLVISLIVPPETFQEGVRRILSYF
ncbi:MAG: pyridoxal phosphate-dependent aminotransferase [Chlamydiae bacterium]|nr:pyridoxal phosphate-dependent aminotransferase [Chlamydiota bacterium]MBI3276481.1 pyridoxal phosphate-dependent aminotransferase [Chlamydiota bacterium]